MIEYNIANLNIRRAKMAGNSTNNQQFDDAETAFKVWKHTGPSASFFTSPMVWLILLIISAIFITLGIGEFSAWMKSEEFLLTYSDTLTNVKALLIVAMVFILLLGLDFKLGPYIGTEIFSNFLLYKKTDLLAFLKKDLSKTLSFSSLEERFSRAVSVNILAETGLQQTNARYKKQKLNRVLIRFILFSIAVIFLSIFIIFNVELCMRVTFFWGKNHFKFSMIENWWLPIVAASFFIIEKILKRKFEKADEKALDEWIQTNLPEYVDVFKREIKDFINTYLKSQKIRKL